MSGTVIYTHAPKELYALRSGKVVIENFWRGLAATFDFSTLPPELHAQALRDLIRNRNSNP